LLTLGETCLAGQFCVRSNGTMEVLKIGYDEAYASLAPGNLLLKQLMQYCAFAESQLMRLNLITGVEWHDDWKPRSQKVWNFWTFNHAARVSGLFRLATCHRALTKMLKGLLHRSRRNWGKPN
jgi:CelD/BcsL family acetyltransferase involved in cellulose biosynthesis